MHFISIYILPHSERRGRQGEENKIENAEQEPKKRPISSCSFRSAFSILFSSPCQPLRSLLGRFFGSSSWSTFAFLCSFCLIHRFELLCWCHTKRDHLTPVHKVIWLAHAHDALRTRTKRMVTRNHHSHHYGGARSGSTQLHVCANAADLWRFIPSSSTPVSSTILFRLLYCFV